jgi:hypothetical protein
MHILDGLRVVNAIFRLIIPRVLIQVFFLAFGSMNGALHLDALSVSTRVVLTTMLPRVFAR